MKRRLARMFLAAVLGLGVTTGLLRAGEPPHPSPYMMPAPYVVAPATQGSLPPEVMLAPEAAPVLDSLAKRRPVRDWLHNHTIGCWAHHNKYGCGSVRSDLNFIFGSCRSFFGEPCLSGRPPSPVPDGYDYRPNRCDCR